jgi:hypothetical protein
MHGIEIRDAGAPRRCMVETDPDAAVIPGGTLGRGQHEFAAEKAFLKPEAGPAVLQAQTS